MDERILVDLASLVRRHPWWRARAELTLALLERSGVRPPASVLDAGCGWGVTLEALESRGFRGTGLDVSRRCLEALDRPDRTLVQADLTRPFSSDAGLDAFDVVLALDVIEHLNDDRAAVAALARLVRPGGGLAILSVPARPDLFSEFDAVQGHRRRYLPDRLRDAFLGTGLAVESVFWWGAWMVPVLKLQRRRARRKAGDTAAEVYRRHLRLPVWPASLLLELAYRLEQPRALAARLRTGTSLFAVARRGNAPAPRS